MPKHRKIALATAILVLAAGAALLWRREHAQQDDGRIVLHGNVEIRQVSLAFNGSERIAELLVQEGDRVAAGQVLGRLDLRTLQLREEQAQARIAAAEQALERLRTGARPQEVQVARARSRAAEADARLAEQNLARLEAADRASRGLAVAQSELDAARARARTARAQAEAQQQSTELVVLGPRKEEIGQADAQLRAARADLALTRQQLREGELRSPVDAVVRARLMEPGEMASPQRPVYTLAVTHPKWIRTWVGGPDLSRVRPGQGASVQADGLAAAIPGTVGYISSVAEFTPKTVQTEELRSSLVYEVRINVDDPQDALRLGQPVSVRLHAGARR